MSDHARLSPSAAHRWMNCPGSPDLEAGCPDTSSKYAAEGTSLHSIMAERLPMMHAQRKLHDFEDLVGKTVFGLPVTFEHARLMAWCADVFKNESGIAPLTHVMVEQRVYIPERNDLYGTGDVLIVDRPLKRLSVIDWKFGAGVQVFAKENEQAIIYALGALVAMDMIEDIEKVRIVIGQPRLDHYDVWTVPVDELRGWLRVLLDAANRTDGSAEYVVGDWCGFCKARSLCPALSSTALSIARTEFDAVAAADPPTLAKGLAAIPAVEAWISAIKAEAHRRLQEGHTIPGYKLVAGRRRQVYPDELMAGAWAQDTLGPSAFSAPSLITPAQLKALAKAKGQDVPDALVAWEKGELRVAKETDDRPQLTSAEHDFADI